MNFSPTEHLSTQRAFTEGLLKLGGKHKNFVVFDANVGRSLGIESFHQTFPERHFRFGNAVRAMFGAASGFVARGKLPFLCSYASAITSRGWDSIRNFLASAPLNLKIVGIQGGLLNGPDGSVNQSFEDFALMRSIPGMKVVCPSDAVEVQKALEVMMLDYGPTYIRLMHLPLPRLYDDGYKFVFGRGHVHGVTAGPGGSVDVVLFATGAVVHTALDAADILERQGKKAKVVNVSSLSPLDENFVLECVQDAEQVVTVEDHNVVGGLGSAVIEILAERKPLKVQRLGLHGFGESGKVDDLFAKYQLDGQGIVDQLQSNLKKT